jgi:hypothetical protein
MALIGAVRTVDDVVGTMRAIDAALPDNDGVKWFNFLYLKVTEALRADTTDWHDRAFLLEFDVVFARLYFDAFASWERDPARTPHAWRPLFERRRDTKLARIQFALAGMNAHINHDLAIALDSLAGLHGRYPSRADGRYLDFNRVNDILERIEATLRVPLATGLTGDIDRAAGDLDSVVMMWNVRKAREAAWTNGEVVWHLRTTPYLQRDYLSKLDRMTSFAGRGLLVPRMGIGGVAAST